mgnify:FL=1
MAQCRVYELTDGSVSIVYPVPENRRSSESLTDWLARAYAQTEQRMPQLQGRPFRDTDTDALPKRKRPDGKNTRDAWSFDPEKGAKIDPAKADKIK